MTRDRDNCGAVPDNDMCYFRGHAQSISNKNLRAEDAEGIILLQVHGWIMQHVQPNEQCRTCSNDW